MGPRFCSLASPDEGSRAESKLFGLRFAVLEGKREKHQPSEPHTNSQSLSSGVGGRGRQPLNMLSISIC